MNMIRRFIGLSMAACLLLFALSQFDSSQPPDYAATQRNVLRIRPMISEEARVTVSHDRWSLVRIIRSMISEESFDANAKQRRRLQGFDFTLTDTVESAEAVELGVTVSFQEIYRTIIFIAVAWVLGTLCSKVGLPSLVGEIATGFLLGPPLADFVPFPEAMVLMGNIGLIGLLLESGINIDVAQLKESGIRAVLMAFTGSVLPLLVGLGLGLWSGEDIQSGISIGATFAPSSFGVAAGALTSGDIINTPTGAMIVASSVVDDVLGLILLAIVEVFTYPSPKAIDFILPFISSFGYLIVLGYSAITWMPRVIEKRILPLFSAKYREFAAFALMFFLLIAYMPLLHYSRASSLTGAFLAGLTFSQINSVHISFVNKGRHLLNWLLRIFFSATIGFQVPVTSFNDPYVLKWGAKFILAILVKMPLGFFVPHYQHQVADDFPYNPYWRDVWITALSVTCRGEFNFIIASFALGAGLITADIYAAIVFAILIACIICPFLLSRVIDHYNKLSKQYLTGDHPIHRIGTTRDGYRPLFLSIQARTPVHWGLQDTFKRALEEAGLLIIDHRSFHTLGMNSVDITELFVQDTKVKCLVAQCFADIEAATNSFRSVEEAMKHVRENAKDSVTEEETAMEFMAYSNQCQEIDDRCDEIKEGKCAIVVVFEKVLAEAIRSHCVFFFLVMSVLVQCLLSDDPSTYTIKVSQWKPFTPGGEQPAGTRAGDAKSYCLLNSQHNDDEDSSSDDGEKDVDDKASTKDREALDEAVIALSVPREVTMHHRRATEPDIDHSDLWDIDCVAQEACRQGHYMVPVSSGHYDVIGGGGADQMGSPILSNRRRASTAPSPFATEIEDEADNIKERLHGYVRQTSILSKEE